MLVRIAKDWDHPDIRRQSPRGTGAWGGVTFTTEAVEECDLLIVLNRPPEDLKVRCPAGNRWLFSQESPIEEYRWHTRSFKYFDKVFTYWQDATAKNILHEQTALPWHIGKSYDELLALDLATAAAAKQDRVSWVTSNATHKAGHKLRMAFKDHLQTQHFDYDLFGRGFSPLPDKFEGLWPYKYSIAIENHACDDYWTEKIADCFLSWTIPIYWGATNILKYFPKNSMILIDPNDHQTSLRTIREAMASDWHGRHASALAEARDLVLNRYQFFPHVRALIDKYGAARAGRRAKHFIPANYGVPSGLPGVEALKIAVKRALYFA